MSGFGHLGQRDGPTVRVGHHHESSPGRFLGRPENRDSGLSRFLLPRVGVLHVEAHGCCPSRCPRSKDAPLIVASVVSMQHDSSRWSADNDDDVIFETDRKSKCPDVESPRFAQVSDEQYEAVEVDDVHAPMLATGKRGPPPVGLRLA
jgi:hypothetical protein